MSSSGESAFAGAVRDKIWNKARKILVVLCLLKASGIMSKRRAEEQLQQPGGLHIICFSTVAIARYLSASSENIARPSRL